MGMTLNKLKLIVDLAIKNGHGRKRVCIDKATFNHPLEEDGATIMPIERMEVKFVGNVDDDGGPKINADGSESGRFTVVLFGEER